MYSYAERIRAVQLYIKFGGCMNAAIHQLGYLRLHWLPGCCWRLPVSSLPSPAQQYR